MAVELVMVIQVAVGEVCLDPFLDIESTYFQLAMLAVMSPVVVVKPVVFAFVLAGRFQQPLFETACQLDLTILVPLVAVQHSGS